MGIHLDLVHHFPFNQVLQRPAKVRQVNSKHRRAQALAIAQHNDFLIRVLVLEPIDEVHFRPNCPFAARRRRFDLLHDVRGRTRHIRLLNNFPFTFRMNNHLHVRMILSDVVDVLRAEQRVDGAVTFPQDEGGFLNGALGVAAEVLARIPDDHFLEGISHRVGGVSSQVLIGKEKDFDFIGSAIR